MKTQIAKFNEEIKNQVFKNTRGNFIHIKLIDNHVYRRGELKFDLCEDTTKQRAIDKKTGKWCFSGSIKSMIKKGTLIPVS